MHIETVSVTAEWSVAGVSASYTGSKSFSFNIDADEPVELIEEQARVRARQLVATAGQWSPVNVQIIGLRVTRPRPINAM